MLVLIATVFPGSWVMAQTGLIYDAVTDRMHYGPAGAQAASQQMCENERLGDSTLFDANQHTFRSAAPIRFTICRPRAFSEYTLETRSSTVAVGVQSLEGVPAIAKLIFSAAQAIPTIHGARNIETLSVHPTTVDSMLYALADPVLASAFVVRVIREAEELRAGMRSIRSEMTVWQRDVESLIGENAADCEEAHLGRSLRQVEGLIGCLEDVLHSISGHKAGQCVSGAVGTCALHSYQRSVEIVGRIVTAIGRLNERINDAEIDGRSLSIQRDLDLMRRKIGVYETNLLKYGLATELTAAGRLNENERARIVGALMNAERLANREVRSAEDISSDTSQYLARLREQAKSAQPIDRGIRGHFERRLRALCRSVLQDEYCGETLGLNSTFANTDDGSGQAAGVGSNDANADSTSMVDSDSQKVRSDSALIDTVDTWSESIRQEVSDFKRELGAANDRLDSLLAALVTLSAAKRLDTPIHTFLEPWPGNAIVQFTVFERRLFDPLVPDELGGHQVAQPIETSGTAVDSTGMDQDEDGVTNNGNLVANGIFEVHQKARWTVFTSLVLSSLSDNWTEVERTTDRVIKTTEYSEQSSVNAVAGVKLYFCEQDLFPEAKTVRRGLCKHFHPLGLSVAASVNRFPGILVGLHLEPVSGVELSTGAHYGRRKRAGGNTSTVRLDFGIGYFAGVGLNLSVLRTLLGSSISGAVSSN